MTATRKWLTNRIEKIRESIPLTNNKTIMCTKSRVSHSDVRGGICGIANLRADQFCIRVIRLTDKCSTLNFKPQISAGRAWRVSENLLGRCQYARQRHNCMCMVILNFGHHNSVGIVGNICRIPREHWHGGQLATAADDGRGGYGSAGNIKKYCPRGRASVPGGRRR